METIKKAVELAGGARKVAVETERSLSLVYHWQKGTRQISAEDALKLSGLIGCIVSPQDICPHVDFSPVLKNYLMTK